MRPESLEASPTLEEKFQNREVFTVEGGRIEVVDITPEQQKTATPVVLAPGWAASPEVLRENIIGLAQTGRRTLSFDAPHGVAVERGSAYDEAELRKTLALLEVLEQKSWGRLTWWRIQKAAFTPHWPPPCSRTSFVIWYWLTLAA